jgi:hypothetical protein
MRFVEYPTGQCPITMAVSREAKRNRLMQVSNNTSLNVYGKLLQMSELDCILCGFTPFQMFMLRIFRRPILRKPASLVKSMRMLKKGSSSCCRRNHWKSSWCGRKSGVRVQQLFTQNSPNCHARHMFGCSTRRTLVRKFPPMRPSMRSSTQTFMQSSVLRDLPQKREHHRSP